MRARPQVCEALLFALALHTGVCYGIKWLCSSAAATWSSCAPSCTPPGGP
uniref:Wingless-type MMTV integration site family, member 11 n=1 Tax=Mus musculus TaxID=10090 RepID=E9PYZ1_MOUSE